MLSITHAPFVNLEASLVQVMPPAVRTVSPEAKVSMAVSAMMVGGPCIFVHKHFV